MASMSSMDKLKPVLYGLLNVASASGIVFANKAVLTTFGFHFIYALTLVRPACCVSHHTACLHSAALTRRRR